MHKLSLKTSVLALAVLLLLMTPATIIHELGHSVVCAMHGYKTEIKIDLLSAITYCYSDEITGNYFYYAFGGLLAFIVIMVPILTARVRSTPWMFIPLLTIASSHGINAIFETILNDYYMSDNSVLPSLLMMISLGIFFGLLIKYGRVDISNKNITLVKRDSDTCIVPTNVTIENKVIKRMLTMKDENDNK